MFLSCILWYVSKPKVKTIINTMAVMLFATQRQKIRMILVLILLACYHNNIEVQNYLLWVALVPHHLSSWQKLYNKSNKSPFLHMTGLTQEHSMLSSMLSSPLVMASVICDGGGHGHCHLTGCWVPYFVTWDARCQISGFVWFLGLLYCCAHASWKWSYEWQWSGCDAIRLQEWSSQMLRRCSHIWIWSVLESQWWQMLLDLWIV